MGFLRNDVMGDLDLIIYSGYLRFVKLREKYVERVRCVFMQGSLFDSNPYLGRIRL
jgi:hypothetical protein